MSLLFCCRSHSYLHLFTFNKYRMFVLVINLLIIVFDFILTITYPNFLFNNNFCMFMYLVTNLLYLILFTVTYQSFLLTICLFYFPMFMI